jgi:DNA-binding transcriptional LysR family regulator
LLISLLLNLNWFYEVNHLSTSLGLVEAGLGISVLPRLATPQREHPLIATVQLENPIVVRSIGLVERRGVRLSPSALRFRDMLINEWRGGAAEIARSRSERGA